MVGTPHAPQLLDAQKGECKLTLPAHREANIGSWFNHAVVSSQAFARKVAALHIGADARRRRRSRHCACAHGLRTTCRKSSRSTLDHAHRAASAVYHLTDPLWAIPAFEAFGEAGQSVARHCLRLGTKSRRRASRPHPRRINPPSISSPMSPRSRRAARRTSCTTSSLCVDNGNRRGVAGAGTDGFGQLHHRRHQEQANVLRICSIRRNWPRCTANAPRRSPATRTLRPQRSSRRAGPSRFK